MFRSRHILLPSLLLLALPACGPGLEPFPFKDAGSGDGGAPLTGCAGLPVNPVQLWRHVSADITLAVAASAERVDVEYKKSDGVLEVVTAVDWADGVGDMSGLVVSKRAFAGDVSHQVQALASLIRKGNVFTSVTIRHPGHLGLTPGGDPMISGTIIDLAVQKAAQLHWVRNNLFSLILGGERSDFTKLPAPPQTIGQDFVLVGSTVLRRGRTQAIFTGGIIHHNDYDIRINKARLRAEDLANGSAVARYSRELSGRCASLSVAADPAVDILWLIDEQEMAQSTRIGLHAEITAMWKEARRLGLDFRMAVAGMGRHKDGKDLVMASLCGGINGNAGGFFSPFNSDELPPRFQPCMLKPSDTGSPGAGNHGLTNMREALVSLLPRAANDDFRLRLGATPVVILVSEGPPQLASEALKSLGILPPFSVAQTAIIEDTIAPFAALLRGVGLAHTAALFPGALGLGTLDGTLVYALTARPDSGCHRGARGTGFIELAQAVGGGVALTCYNNIENENPGSVGHVMVDLVQDISRRLRPLKLTRGTISSSLAVSNGHTDGGAAMPRSLRAGFDFHATSASLLLYRDANATAPKVSPLSASYLSW